MGHRPILKGLTALVSLYVVVVVSLSSLLVQVSAVQTEVLLVAVLL